MTRMPSLRAWLWLPLMLSVSVALAAEPLPVALENLTSPELRARIAGGSTTVLVPVGGTEQNGAHMVLGKHNARARLLSELIARRLGNALVAPVLAYVPEGALNPPGGHMRFSGTLSLPEATFEAVLEAAARSLRQHGFRDIVLLGDHGGYQSSLEKVAARLNREWRADPRSHVHALLDYYRVTQTSYPAALRAHGVSAAELGLHAGLADTSLTLALDKTLVRSEALPGAAGVDGVSGDPRRASAELGQLGVNLIVEASVTAIRQFTAPAAPQNSTSSSRR
jgi:creatinine amidohydrolase/Fe(II)-dependent formamide hydrolase-like protein